MSCPAGNKKCDAAISNFSVEVKKVLCEKCKEPVRYYCGECEETISETKCECEKAAG